MPRWSRTGCTSTSTPVASGPTRSRRKASRFTAGTSKLKLTKRYGIGESSIKWLIRQYWSSKQSSEFIE
jgi:hypothetical protein